MTAIVTGSTSSEKYYINFHTERCPMLAIVYDEDKEVVLKQVSEKDESQEQFVNRVKLKVSKL